MTDNGVFLVSYLYFLKTNMIQSYTHTLFVCMWLHFVLYLL